MRYILVSDIFGRTDALVKMASELATTVDIFDPYGSENMEFKNEIEAYNYFISHIGFEQYAENLLKTIKSYSEELCLIGFSIGASAIWKISSKNNVRHIIKTICFYGSQIRNDTNIEPRFPVQLIFPVIEKHFSITELIEELSDRKNTEIIKTSYLHGFMNQYSVNYNQSAYKEYIDLINAEI